MHASQHAGDGCLEAAAAGVPSSLSSLLESAKIEHAPGPGALLRGGVMTPPKSRFATVRMGDEL